MNISIISYQIIPIVSIDSNKVKRVEYHKQYREKTREKRIEYGKQYRKKNREKWAEYSKQYREKNREKIREKIKQYREKNQEKLTEYIKQYREKNRKKIREWTNQYTKQRLETDPLFKAKRALRRAVVGAFKRISKNKPTRAEQLLGCNWLEAKAHFERLFKEGMSWENHGEWHIDHIKPVASFKENELHLMNHISNLQPLWAEDNTGSKKRSDKIKWLL